jgi:hypothetical protein
VVAKNNNLPSFNASVAARREFSNNHKMQIERLLKDHAFTPDATDALVAAYEAALTRLDVRRYDERKAELVARKIIDVAEQGVRDPNTLCDRAVWALSK